MVNSHGNTFLSKQEKINKQTITINKTKVQNNFLLFIFFRLKTYFKKDDKIVFIVQTPNHLSPIT